MTDREDTPDLFAKAEGQGAAPAPGQEQSGSAAATLGARLRAAREAKGLAIGDCARSLHLPVKALQRLEADDFGEPEHFVFLRGTLKGYARFLGLPSGTCDEALRMLAPARQPELVSVARTSPARWLLQRYGTAATYIVLTATIAVPLVLLGLRGGLDRPAAQIVSLDQAPAAATQLASPAAPGTSAAASAASPDATPFRASMTPFAAIGMDDVDKSVTPIAPATVATARAVVGQHSFTVTANADCWFEITSADGAKVDSGMLHAGDVRTWHAQGPWHVTLGNAAGVAVTSDGKPLDLDASRQGNVAHLDLFGTSGGGSEND